MKMGTRCPSAPRHRTKTFSCDKYPRHTYSPTPYSGGYSAALSPEKIQNLSRSVISPRLFLATHTHHLPSSQLTSLFEQHLPAMSFFKIVTSVSKSQAIGASFAASTSATVVLYSFLQSTGLCQPIRFVFLRALSLFL